VELASIALGERDEGRLVAAAHSIKDAGLLGLSGWHFDGHVRTRGGSGPMMHLLAPT
jgi:hypothetical protein